MTEQESTLFVALTAAYTFIKENETEGEFCWLCDKQVESDLHDDMCIIRICEDALMTVVNK